MEPRVAPSEVTRPSGDDPHQRHASATHDDPLDWHAIDGRHFANVEPMADPPVGSNNVRRSDAVAWRTSARQTQSVWLRPLVVKSPISAVVAICDVVAAWRDGHIIKRPASNGVRSRRIGVCAAPPGAIARPPHQEMNIKAPLPREEVPSSTCGGRKLADPLRRRLAVFRDQSPETLAFPGVFLTPPFSD